MRRDDFEDTRVTIHVGMLGSDGIVLAGDVQTNTEVTGQMVEQARSPLVWITEPASKIAIEQDGNVAISRARDLRQTRTVASAIAAGLSSEFWINSERKIEHIAEEALGTHPWRASECLIALNEPYPLLLKLQCYKDPETLDNVCSCEPYIGYAFAGDCHNPATFWAARYFFRDPPKAWTVQELIPFAAQIIVDAGQINSGPIRGLEIVYSDESGFHRLPESENRAPVIEAMKRSKSAGKAITSRLSAKTMRAVRSTEQP